MSRSVNRSEESQERERQRDRDRYAARKRFWQTFIAQKDQREVVCVECGLPETDPHNPLTYSHNKGTTKSFNLTEAISRFIRKTHAEMEAEARKCSLRHHRCHNVFDGKQEEVAHGTRSCYVGGCRRPECCKASADYKRNRRQINQAVRESENKRSRDNLCNRRANDSAYREAVNKANRDARARKKAAKQELYNNTIEALLSAT